MPSVMMHSKACRFASAGHSGHLQPTMVLIHSVSCSLMCVHVLSSCMRVGASHFVEQRATGSAGQQAVQGLPHAPRFWHSWCIRECSALNALTTTNNAGANHTTGASAAPERRPAAQVQMHLRHCAGARSPRGTHSLTELLSRCGCSFAVAG